jgi:hypothetical protein
MIPLYSYLDAFNEGKMRPGFRIENKLFVLTSVKPRTNYMILAGPCCSGHFATQGKKYVTLASNQEALRYNNVVGGYLTIDTKRFERKFNVNTRHYHLTTHSFNMKKVQCFGLTPAGVFLLTNAAEYAASTSLTSDELKTKFGLVLKDGKPLTVEGLPEDFAGLMTVAQNWVATESTDEKAVKNAAKWAAQLGKAAIAAAKADIAEILDAAYGETAGALLVDMTDDKDVPAITAELAALLSSTPETREAANLAITNRFGNMEATWNGEGFEVIAQEEAPAVPETAPEEGTPAIDVTALAEALVENQQPIAEGAPAEEVTEPKGEIVVQLADQVPATPEVVKIAASLVRDAAEQAKADRELANQRFNEDAQLAESRFEKSLKVAETLLNVATPQVAANVEEAILAN